MDRNKKVLYLSQEITPYMAETEISRVSRQLPQAVQELGNEVRIFMPRYGLINERRNQLHEVIRLSGINMIINDNDHPLIIKVASIQAARMQVYFIDNDDFFKRKARFADGHGKMFLDNDERAIFFVRGALEAIKKLRWLPDIVHCHGAFTALAALYLKTLYKDDPYLKNAKVLYSCYKEDKPVEIPETIFEKLSFDKIKSDAVDVMQGKGDYLALCRIAAKFADGVIEASADLPEEVKTILKEADKPLLAYPGEEENYVDAYNLFYDKLLAK